MRWSRVVPGIVIVSSLLAVLLLGPRRAGQVQAPALPDVLQPAGPAAKDIQNAEDLQSEMSPAVLDAAVWSGWPQPPRVGLQVGHWKAADLPEELARLRKNEGTAGGGVRELEVNRKIARLVKQRLEAAGVAVDLIPATVPIRYQADAFVAIHADGSWDPDKRGWKLATYWTPSAASQQLADWLMEHYNQLGIPYDPKITANMRGYYAFNRKYSHAIANTTPGVILELGFVTNAEDRALMVDQADRVADAVSAGILAFLLEHNPTDDALVFAPPDLSPVRPTAPISAYTAPSEDATVIRTVYPAEVLEPIERRGAWIKAPLPPEWNRMGWVRLDLVTEARPPLKKQ